MSSQLRVLPHVVNGVTATGALTTTPVGDGSGGSIPMPVSGIVTVNNPSVGPNGAAIPSDSTLIGTEDGSGKLQPVSSTNPLPVSGTITATADAKANAVAPILVEGSLNPFSTDLSANLRVTNTTATPAGSNIIGKVGIDQTTPGSTNAADATNFPVTVDTNAGAAGASTIRVAIATGGATPLPTGAATAANQTNVQSAPGSPQTIAITIQGNASGVAVPVSGTFWQATQPVSQAAPSNTTVSAYAASLIIKASAGTLYGLTGYNSGPGQFLQIHDAAVLPADTAVPAVVLYAQPNSPFSLDYGAKGRAFTTGIVICNSSTGPTKTIGSANCWFDGQYA